MNSTTRKDPAVPRRSRMAAAGIALAGALALSACGAGGDPTAGPAADGGAAGTAVAGSVSPLPAVDVVDVASGETVALASLLPADKATLVWMWAPH